MSQIWINSYCNRYKKVTYYTLKDIMTKYCLDNETWNINYDLGYIKDNEFVNCMQNLYDPIDPVNIDYTPAGTEEANELWCRYFVPLYKDMTILKTESNEDESDLHMMAINWFSKYMAILNLTYKRYKTLIDNYKNEEANLLNSINSTSIDRFNDTPQNGGDFTNDSYTSTYRNLEVKSDGNTKMARLDEIRRAWRDLYVNWTNEFASLFIYSASVN